MTCAGSSDTDHALVRCMQPADQVVQLVGCFDLQQPPQVGSAPLTMLHNIGALEKVMTQMVSLLTLAELCLLHATCRLGCWLLRSAAAASGRVSKWLLLHLKALQKVRARRHGDSGQSILCCMDPAVEVVNCSNLQQYYQVMPADCFCCS